MEWIDVNERLPNELDTVWMYNVYTNFIALGAHVFVGDGYVWSKSNNLIYEEDGLIFSECEIDDDYEITHWIPLPELPKKK